jgi:hypothetical protein
VTEGSLCLGHHSLIAAGGGFWAACTNSSKNDYARPQTKTIAVFEKEIRNAEHRQKTVSFADGCIGIIGNSPAPAQALLAIASSVPTKNMTDPKGLPSPVLLFSVTPELSTPMFQTRQEIFGRPILSPGNFTLAAEEDACRIIEATLLYTNGPKWGECLARYYRPW